MPPASPHATTPEAAAYLRRSEQTLINWRYQEVGPPYIKVRGGRVLYRWADLDRWLDSQTVTPAAASRTA